MSSITSRSGGRPSTDISRRIVFGNSGIRHERRPQTVSFYVPLSKRTQNGWLVTNFFGLVVLLSIYVMTHAVAALMSFQMISLVPHHLPKLIGFASANRVDMDQFSRDAALVGVGGTLQKLDQAAKSTLPRQSLNNQIGSSSRPALPAPPKGLPGPSMGTAAKGTTGSVDSTLNASTDISRTPGEEA